MASILPSQTLYINNLNTKTKKAQLKAALLAVFSPFGKIMDVVACKTKALRGQAWVVFADVSSAADAMRQMQGFPFFDKPMRLAYAKTKSDAVAKAEGVPVGKRKRNDDMVGMGDDGDEEAAPPAAKRVNLAEAVSSAAAGAPLAAAAALVMPLPPAPTPVIAPSNVLLATGLPMDGSISSDQLRTLFSTYPGFKDVRHIVERGIAFVEYGNEAQSTPALQGLNNFKLTPTVPLMLMFATK